MAFSRHRGRCYCGRTGMRDWNESECGACGRYFCEQCLHDDEVDDDFYCMMCKLLARINVPYDRRTMETRVRTLETLIKASMNDDRRTTLMDERTQLLATTSWINAEAEAEAEEVNADEDDDEEVPDGGTLSDFSDLLD